MTIAFETQLTQLTDWFERTDTLPALSATIIDTLRSRASSTLFAASEHLTEDIKAAADQQDIIGWDNFLKGRVATGWREAQLLHFRAIHSNRSIDRWCADFVEKLLRFSFFMWKTRNDILHERDAQGLQREDSNKLRESLIEAFNAGAESLYGPDQHLITDTTLANVLALPVTAKRNWLLAVRSAREYKVAMDNDATEQQTVIEDYFAPAGMT